MVAISLGSAYNSATKDNSLITPLTNAFSYALALPMGIITQEVAYSIALLTIIHSLTHSLNYVYNFVHLAIMLTITLANAFYQPNAVAMR